MSGTSQPEMADLTALEQENALLLAALQKIADQFPACSPEAEEVWSNRRWSGAFRDLQRIAMIALEELKVQRSA